MQKVGESFAIVAIFLITAIAFVFISILLSRLLQPRKYSVEKAIPYECGENPVGLSWIQYNFRYYIYALVFLIFDVEVALLYPWAVVYKNLGWLGFVEAVVFVFILLIPFIYLWQKGSLEWFITPPEE